MKRITMVTLVHTAGLFVALGVLGSNAVAAAKEAPANLSISQQRVLEGEISSLVYDVMRTNNKVQGQGVVSKPKVAYDQATKIIVIDLGRNAVPREYTPSFESQLALIEINIFETIGEKLEIDHVEFLFGGVDIYYFFPDARPAESAILGAMSSPATATSNSTQCGRGWWKPLNAFHGPATTATRWDTRMHC